MTDQLELIQRIRGTRNQGRRFIRIVTSAQFRNLKVTSLDTFRGLCH